MTGLYADSRMREQGRGGAGHPVLRQQLRAVVVVLVVGALLMALLGVVSPEGGVRFALIVLVAYAAVVVVELVLEPFGHLERASRRRRRRGAAEAAVPPFVERAARQVELARGSAVRFEQLRGRLVEIAEQRLAGRGMRLDSEGALEVLGGEAWRLLTRPLEGEKFAPGPSTAELDRLLAALERV